MAATLSPVPKLQFFDANGAPLAGGKLYSYFAGTTTPQSTYTDSTGTTSNPNPVILDARGEAGVWLANDAFYKLSLYTSTNVLVWTVDQISGNATLSALAASGGSALIGYLPAGAGAVATTVQAKLRESVSVKDFENAAAMSGDWTTALQAAINYCCSDNPQGAKALYLPAGTYTITSTLSIPKQFITIYGDGMWESVISFGTTAGGGLTTAVMTYLRPMFRDFAIRGEIGSGIALNFGNITGQVYLGEIRNVHLEAGANAMFAPRFFSMVMQNVAASSWSGHAFVVACGPGTTWTSCYAIVCGAGKAGYRLTGSINMIACNGLNSGDWWGIFGQDSTAVDGYQNDFPGLGTVYSDTSMIGCNIEDYATASVNGGGIMLHSPFYDFNLQGGKIDRFSRTTGYKAIIQARTNGNISGNPIKLAPSAIFLGTGVPSLAYVYTNTGAKFSDEIGAFAAAGITTWTDAGAGLNYPLLRQSTVSDVYGDTAYFVSAIQPRRLSIQMTRYVVPATLTPVGTNQTINVTGAVKVIVSPAAAASINIATFTNTTGVVSDSGRNGDLIIEAGNSNLTIVHNALGTGSQAFFLAGGANVAMGTGQLKRFCYSTTANMWIEA